MSYVGGNTSAVLYEPGHRPLAPEFTEWVVFFAAASATRAALLAGVTRNVTQRAADDLVREAAHFTDLVAEAIAAAGAGRA